MPMPTGALRLAAVSFCLALVSACGSDPDPGDADVDLDAASDVGADTAEPATDVVADTVAPDTTPPGCVPGSLDCESVQWLQVDGFPTGVDHHTTFIRTADSGDTYVYVVGGVTSAAGSITVHSAVRRAKIASDRTLGAWTDEPPLPAPLGFHGIAESPSAIWLAAGVSSDADGVSATNASYIGRFDTGGGLTFEVGPDLPPEVRVHPTAHRVGDTLVIIGGSGPQQTPRDSTLMATIGSDDTLSAWVPGPTLPEPRSHHASAVHNGRIWVFGGFTLNQAPLPGILMSEHDGDGAPVGWTRVGEMLDPPWTAAATVYQDGILLIGGGQGGPGSEQYVDRVRYSAFTNTGGFEPFVDLNNPLPRARAHAHQVPLHDGFLYSVGGRNLGQSSISEVYLGFLAF